MSAWIDRRGPGSWSLLRRNRERTSSVEVEQALAERGLDAAKLKEIQELNRQASFLPSYEANHDETLEAIRQIGGIIRPTAAIGAAGAREDSARGIRPGDG